MDKLAIAAHAAGFAMVGTEELVAEPPRQSPDVPAPRETMSRDVSPLRTATTALMQIKPATPSSTSGWSFFWKAPAGRYAIAIEAAIAISSDRRII